MHASRRAPGVAALALVVSLIVVGCGGTPAPVLIAQTPTSAVSEVLVLREKRSTEASAYAPYFSDPDMAQLMSNAAAAASTTHTPIPRWDQPYISAEASGVVEVAIVWKDTKDYPGWPTVTVFVLENRDSRWVILRSQGSTGTPPPPVGK